MSQFEKTNEAMLAVTLNKEKILSKTGAMVAYEGNVNFSKAILGGEGLFGALKRKLANERESLMTTEGSGTVYYASDAKDITCINLKNETITLESDCLLAYDSTVNTDIEFSGVNGIVSGQGLFTTTMTGCGNISIISDGELIALEVTPQNSLYIDPDAFIAFKGDLLREFILDVNWKTMVGQASGESYQIKFSGTGVVYIQPSER